MEEIELGLKRIIYYPKFFFKHASHLFENVVFHLKKKRVHIFPVPYFNTKQLIFHVVFTWAVVYLH